MRLCSWLRHQEKRSNGIFTISVDRDRNFTHAGTAIGFREIRQDEPQWLNPYDSTAVTAWLKSLCDKYESHTCKHVWGTRTRHPALTVYTKAV